VQESKHGLGGIMIEKGGANFGWYVESSVGNVEIPNYEDESRGHGCLLIRGWGEVVK
jgi:hypothetical protein